MSKTRWICYNGIGIALFVALSLCLQVPVFENYYLCLGYFVMITYCFFIGPASGAIIGFLGVVLYCVLINGLRGMPGWSLGNLLIGLAVGTACSMTTHMKKPARLIIVYIIIITSTAIAMLGVKSAIESVIYAQPLLLRTAKNIYAFVADAAVLLVGYPMCLVMEPAVSKLINKRKEKKKCRKEAKIKKVQ